MLFEELDKCVGKPRTDEQRAYNRASTARFEKPIDKVLAACEMMRGDRQ